MMDKRVQIRIKKPLLQGIMQDKDKWMYRAVLFSRVLEHLGYNPHNIMNADKEILSNGVLKTPEKIIKDFQI
jgi:hypothetical protein